VPWWSVSEHKKAGIAGRHNRLVFIPDRSRQLSKQHLKLAFPPLRSSFPALRGSAGNDSPFNPHSPALQSNKFLATGRVLDWRFRARFPAATSRQESSSLGMPRSWSKRSSVSITRAFRGRCLSSQRGRPLTLRIKSILLMRSVASALPAISERNLVTASTTS